jgi:hypothetical protein
VKKLILALTLGVCAFAMEQSRNAATPVQAAPAEPHSALATSSCAFTFTTGANDSFMKYCATANGNIAQLEAPVGEEHLAIGTIGEGYGFCDLSTSVRYFDYSDFGDSGNWGAPTLVSQSATAVKIARTTTDGVWTLTQTITQVRGMSPAVRIAMTVKNNSGALRGLFFMRYADVDAGGALQNNFDGTQKSVFGWNSAANSTSAVGLLLQNAGPIPAGSSPGGFTQNVPSGPDPCAFANHVASGPQIATDGSIFYLYALNVPKGGSKMVTVSYQRL